MYYYLAVSIITYYSYVPLTLNAIFNILDTEVAINLEIFTKRQIGV